MKLRKLLPKTFFVRGLLIVVLPVLLAEAVSAYIFYKRHWENVTRHMSNALAGEISFLVYEEQNLSRQEREEMEWAFSWTTGIAAHFVPHATLPQQEIYRPQDFPELGTILRRRLEMPISILRANDAERLDIHVQLPDGVLQFTTSAKRLESSTTTIFILWTLGSTVLFLAIALAFLRNQVRPIRQLAEAAERFGKGGGIMDLKPHGAQEVRRAARAFLVMRERILRQIRSRTEMLAGISHDLRTPLTRMKLQLALLGNLHEAHELAADVAQMEHMIAEYLDFARGDAGETAETMSLADVFSNIADDYRRAGKEIAYHLTQDVTLQLRPQAFRRLLANVINNALRYGKHCFLSANVSANKVDVLIDDDGSGIPPDKREEVFRPFQRLDPSRNQNVAGVGLGLTIARDIARSHGGNITLADSPQGGLRVIVRLPL